MGHTHRARAAVVCTRHPDDHSIAVITLQKEPVNSMNLDLWEPLYAEFQAVNHDPTVRAIIFESGLERNVFTAGLDIKELYAPATNETRLKNFWDVLSRTLIAIYCSPKITVAAVAGACPAGGCCLALCCDYRVITQDGSMGLNEVALGIPVPIFWVKLMISVIGQRAAERVLSTGVMIPAQKLLSIGMADALVEGRDELLMHAVTELKKNYLRHPPEGMEATKTAIREDLTQAWTEGKEREAQIVWDCISSEKTVRSLSLVLEALGGGGKKKKSKL